MRRGDRRAAHDAAEDIDQHRLHVLVGQQDAKGLGHLLDVRPAADVEKIRRLAAVQLDQVHRAHRQARRRSPGSRCCRRASRSSGPPAAARTSAGSSSAMSRSSASSLWRNMRVVVEGHLGVEREQLARSGHHQRVDLGQAAIVVDEHPAQRPHELLGRADAGPVRPSFAAQLADLIALQAGVGIEMLP